MGILNKLGIKGGEVRVIVGPQIRENGSDLNRIKIARIERWLNRKKHRVGQPKFAAQALELKRRRLSLELAEAKAKELSKQLRGEE